ncbi:MAG: NAD(P)-binding protein [Lutisporaceae bacterium]|jgi:digeranylgeranylglycerophospholipid reductase
MRVAIIGAGLSGLSCAIELEKHCIRPVIFEMRAHIGESIDYALIWPRILNMPIMDPLKYLKKQYGLQLMPVNHMKKIIMYSPKAKATERGSLGYIFRRGYSKDALEYQLLNCLKAPIIFNRYAEIEDIINEFNFVVAATSNSIISKKLKLWTDTFLTLIPELQRLWEDSSLQILLCG